MRKPISLVIYLRTLFLATIVCTSAMAFGQTEHYYAFHGPDGQSPSGSLITDNVGNLYGVTILGGTAGVGVVYQISKLSGHATEKVLYSFTGTQGDGAYPVGNLIFDTAGNLYGTTSGGGTYNQGTIFKLSPPDYPANDWTLKILYTFTGQTGGGPQSGLIMDAEGNLYGTTSSGGDYGLGTVFELDRNNKLETLHSFMGSPSDGRIPLASLIIDSDMNLYGTTAAGGAYDNGTVFELSSSGGVWAETILHTFGAAGDGVAPYDPLTMNQFGVLAGTTITGVNEGQSCGTVFTLGPPPDRPYGILYSFGQDGDGCNIVSGVAGANGVMFGTTQLGGLNSDQGTVFELTRSPGSNRWMANTVFTFNGNDGENPEGLTIYKNKLYGVTGNGGDLGSCGGRGCGTVFELGP